MEHNPVEERAGMRWLLGAGLAALILSAGLFLADEALSNSPRERNLGATLKGLRTAQTSLSTLPTDERLEPK
jgi:hypothetical protein